MFEFLVMLGGWVAVVSVGGIILVAVAVAIGWAFSHIRRRRTNVRRRLIDEPYEAPDGTTVLTAEELDEDWAPDGPTVVISRDDIPGAVHNP